MCGRVLDLAFARGREKIPAHRGGSFRAGAAIQGLARGGTRRGHRPHGIHAGPTRPGRDEPDVADQRLIRSASILFNPGKIIADGRFEMDSDLRARTELALPFEPVLAFSARDESFLGNLDQCNGCGVCLKANADDVPDLHRDRRGNHVHARAGKHHPRGAGIARFGKW